MRTAKVSSEITVSKQGFIHRRICWTLERGYGLMGSQFRRKSLPYIFGKYINCWINIRYVLVMVLVFMNIEVLMLRVKNLLIIIFSELEEWFDRNLVHVRAGWGCCNVQQRQVS